MFLWGSQGHVRGGVGILHHHNRFRRARRSTGDGGAGRGGAVSLGSFDKRESGRVT